MSNWDLSLKKLLTKFVKIENGITYEINFRWDGRGGVTVLNTIGYNVYSNDINRAFKSIFGIAINCGISTAYGYHGKLEHHVEIPVMYSKKALELANNMNFKELAKVPFEEKYPTERIIHSANFVYDLIIEKLFTYISHQANEKDIYNIRLKDSEIHN